MVLVLRGAHVGSSTVSSDEEADEECWRGATVVQEQKCNADDNATTTKPPTLPRKRRMGKKRHHKGEKRSLLCKICTGFVVCCMLPFLLCFLYVVLYLVPTLDEEQEQEANVHWHKEFVDRGAAYGGKRPVMLSDLRLDTTLQCEGLTKEQSNEMVYWQRIESDRKYTSPFYRKNLEKQNNSTTRTTKNNKSQQQYLTFMPDGGGFNNIRMSLETVLTLAHAMGRTLVLPPAHEMYLLYDDQTKNGEQKSQPQNHHFGFSDFFPMESIAANQYGLDIITMQDFLEHEGLSGNLHDRTTGQVRFPPMNNRTDWNGDTDAQMAELWPYLEQVAFMPGDWNPDECVVAFASTSDDQASASLKTRFREKLHRDGSLLSFERYIDNPARVYGNVWDRLTEILNERTELCLYEHRVVHEPIVHLHGRSKWNGRLLVPFYSFVFFQDWRQALWTKRFVRDQLRYTDEIQCAAARVVAAVRERARQQSNSKSNNPQGLYSAFHVRRGEFQYKKTRVSAVEMYNISQPEIALGSTVYMATDERDKSFFRDMAGPYDLVFLDDFRHLLEGINSNYYGMIDQLVASKAEIFFGCWFST